MKRHHSINRIGRFYCLGGVVLAVLGIALLLVPVAADAQGRGGRRYYRTDFPQPDRDIFPQGAFTFARVRYSSGPYGRSSGSWATDYPASDLNFPLRLEQLTTIKIEHQENGDPKHVVVDLTEDTLFDYPFIYMLEVGNLVFSEEEAKALRSYLLRGGFLMVDDFWGEGQWLNWVIQINKVFDPIDYKMEDLKLDHPVFNIVFKLDEFPQVPSINHWVRTGGDTSEQGYDSRTPHYRGIHDKNGRLMVIVCHNTDLGDGWEREGEREDYFQAISVPKAYPMGINIVVYAMTH
jgi:hypothetical protein